MMHPSSWCGPGVLVVVLLITACGDTDDADAPAATATPVTETTGPPLTGTIPETIPPDDDTIDSPDTIVPDSPRAGTPAPTSPTTDPGRLEPEECRVSIHQEQQCEYSGGVIDPERCECVITESSLPQASVGDVDWRVVGHGWHLVLYDGTPVWQPDRTQRIDGPWALDLVGPTGETYRMVEWEQTSVPGDHWVRLQAWSPDGTEVVVDVDGVVTLIDLESGEQRALVTWQAGSGEWVGFTRPTGSNLVRVWFDANEQGFERRSRDWELLADLVWDDLIRFTSEPGPGFDWLYAWNGEEIVVDVEALDGLHLIRNDGTYARQLDTALAEQCDLIRWGNDPQVVEAECVGRGVTYVHTDGSRPFFLNDALSVQVPAPEISDVFTISGDLCFLDAVSHGHAVVVAICGSRDTFGLARPTEDGVLQWVGGLGDGPLGNYLVDMYGDRVYFVGASEEQEIGPAFYSIEWTGGNPRPLVPWEEGTTGVSGVIPWQGEPIPPP